jgi:hypothetical protein
LLISAQLQIGQSDVVGQSDNNQQRVEGGHFDPYLKQFPRASAAAVSWFRQHLVAGSHEQ